MKIDKKLNTEKIDSKLINYITEKIVAEIRPKKIILFGSYAKGEFNSESDLDLFIVNDSSSSNREVRRKIDALLRGRKFPVDLLVRNPEEIELNRKANNNFYIAEILKKGKVLYEKS
jgi:predicted nucleotidyltransferase